MNAIDALVTAADSAPSPQVKAQAYAMLYTIAGFFAGRPIEIEQTEDGKWIALWMHFQAPPPPKADTQAKALAAFINMMLQRQEVDANLPEVDTKEDTGGTDDRSQPVDN